MKKKGPETHQEKEINVGAWYDKYCAFQWWQEKKLLSSILSPTLQVVSEYIVYYDTIIASLIAPLHRTPGTYNNVGPKKLL